MASMAWRHTPPVVIESSRPTTLSFIEPSRELSERNSTEVCEDKAMLETVIEMSILLCPVWNRGQLMADSLLRGARTTRLNNAERARAMTKAKNDAW